ncbi:hypothetical protein ACFZDB_31770 [Streptomyces luteogriseus]|nr:hypothetical protein [Streptomyces sp. NRRL S-475]
MSALPGRCEIGGDVRPTPGFGARAARALVRAAVGEPDTVPAVLDPLTR